MKIFWGFVFCILQNFYFHISCEAISRASYQETCSKELRCDSRKFLTCSSGLCDCLMPDTMTYDNSSEKCVTLAGERCQYTTEDAEKTWTDEVPCISNARCQNGVCECGNIFYEIPNGTCQPKRNFGADCLNNNMCDNSKHLHCDINQTCACKSTRIWMDGKCKLLLGNTCRLIEDSCVDGAYCKTSRNVSKCECGTNFYSTQNGTCEQKKRIGESCIKTSECKNTVLANVDSKLFFDHPSFLVCVDGKCQCNERISVKISDDTDRFCGKYLDHPCKEGECISGATCSGVCQCKESTHYKTENNTCSPKKEFGQTCQSNRECLDKFPCDLTKKKCECPNGKSFSPVTKGCVGSVGSSCSQYSNVQYECVPGATCYYTSGRYACKCTDSIQTQTVTGYGGYCYIKNNGTCNGDTLGPLATKMCMPGLVCLNHKCVCPYQNHQIYNETTLTCRSYVGGPCTKTRDCLNETAECGFVNGVNQCRCKKGFTEADRECDIAYGEKCDLGNLNMNCDRYGPLQCSTKGICDCPRLQTYDNETLSCRGLVGAKCETSLNLQKILIERFCVDGAYCKPFRGFRATVGLCACQPGWEAKEDRTCSLAKPFNGLNIMISDEALETTTGRQ